MNFKELIVQRLGLSFKSPKMAVYEEIQKEAKSPKKRLSTKLKIQRNYPIDLDQQFLKQAIMTAENPELPQRALLYDVYKEAMRDLHLRSCFRTAENKVLGEAWAVVDENNEINKELTLLFQKQWFEDCCRHALQEEWWGHSLIELGMFKPNANNELELCDVKLIPRKNVRPEWGELLLFEGDVKGLPYREEPFNTYLIEAGMSDNLGLLEIAAKYAIYKKYAIADWARSAEKWGDPVLVVRSASDDESENDKKAEFAANFGNNGWAIFDDDDQIELLERANGSGYAIFKDLLSYVDAENSKGANGQTATSDNQAWAGTSEVQERILDNYTNERARSLMYWINDKLIPKLIDIEGGQTAYSKLKGYKYMPLKFITELKTPIQIAQEKQEQQALQPAKPMPQGGGPTQRKKYHY